MISVGRWELCEDKQCEDAEDGLVFHYHLVLTHPDDGPDDDVPAAEAHVPTEPRSLEGMGSAAGRAAS